MAKLVTFVKAHRHLYSKLLLDCAFLRHLQSAIPLHRSIASLGQRLPSALYVNNLDSSKSPTVEVDLDVLNIHANKESLQKNITNRGLSIDIDKMLNLHDTYMVLNAHKASLEKEREEVANATKHIIKQLKKTTENEEKKKALILRGKAIKKELQKLLPQYYSAEEELVSTALKLPPEIDSQTVNSEQELEVIGQVPDRNVTTKSHVALGADLGCLRYSPLSPGAYFLIGDWAKLERNILKKAEQHLTNHNVHLLSGPDFYKHVIIEGSGRELGNPEEAFYVQWKDGNDGVEGVETPLCLEGVGLSVFTGFLMRRVALTGDLPLRLASVGPAYLPEFWDYDSKRDLCSTPQISAASTFGAASCYDDASALMEEFQALYKEFYTWCGVPVRVVRRGSKQLRVSETCRVDFEVWMPSHQKFITCGSVSHHADFLSRRLMMYHTPRHDGEAHKPQYQHTVGGRMVNVSVLLAAIMENSQAGISIPTA